MALTFTTSWDDGSVLDLRVAELLDHRGMMGTFYVPQDFTDRREKVSAYSRRLSSSEIRSMAARHEIGGHSLTHRRLTELSFEEAKGEIAGSREFIADVTGVPPSMFAFVGGAYNEALVRATKEAGFVGARTTHKLALRTPTDFMVDTTIICQPFPFRKKNSEQYYWGRLFDPLFAYEPTQVAVSWFALAKRIFRRAYAEGNYFHLYGHSWELERYGMWHDLEAFLDFVQEHSNITYATNGEVAQHI